MVVFYLIIFYIYAALVLLYLRIMPTNDFKVALINVYTHVIFGALAIGDSYNIQYATIIVVVGTMVVTVMILNMIVAFLSNLYSKLEELQVIIEMKERSKSIVDTEISLRMLKKMFCQKVDDFESQKFIFILKPKNDVSDDFLIDDLGEVGQPTNEELLDWLKSNISLLKAHLEWKINTKGNELNKKIDIVDKKVRSTFINFRQQKID